MSVRCPPRWPQKIEMVICCVSFTGPWLLMFIWCQMSPMLFSPLLISVSVISQQLFFCRWIFFGHVTRHVQFDQLSHPPSAHFIVPFIPHDTTTPWVHFIWQLMGKFDDLWTKMFDHRICESTQSHQFAPQLQGFQRFMVMSCRVMWWEPQRTPGGWPMRRVWGAKCMICVGGDFCPFQVLLWVYSKCWVLKSENPFYHDVVESPHVHQCIWFVPESPSLWCFGHFRVQVGFFLQVTPSSMWHSKRPQRRM